MSALTGVRGQVYRDILYSISGTIGSSTAPQLVLPEHRSRSLLAIVNTSDTQLYAEIGAGEATATILAGGVNAVAVVNGGFGFTIPPVVEFLGGGSECNSTFVGCGQPGYGAPGSSANFGRGNDTPGNRPATAHAVLTMGVVTSIVVDDPGQGYVAAPFVLLRNSVNDPNGAADPSLNSGSGFPIPSGAVPLTFSAGMCPTSPVALFCPVMGKTFVVKWMN